MRVERAVVEVERSLLGLKVALFDSLGSIGNLKSLKSVISIFVETFGEVVDRVGVASFFHCFRNETPP